jgi:ribonuclease PH
VKIIPGYVSPADGSCLIQTGGTRVLCTASFEPGVPEWLKGAGGGWVTGEYGMLPASGGRRKRRPVARPDGRSTEIGRLIGRVLRGVVRMDRLGENTIYLDCDVLTADGGTRTAAITGAYVALAGAVVRLEKQGRIGPGALDGPVAAVSVGICNGRTLLDLDYSEDASAEVDMNVAMTAEGRYVEVQATAERGRFDRRQLQAMLQLAGRGIRRLIAAQRRALAGRA